MATVWLGIRMRRKSAQAHALNGAALLANPLDRLSTLARLRKGIIQQRVECAWDVSKRPASAVSVIGTAPPLDLKRRPQSLLDDRAEVSDCRICTRSTPSSFIAHARWWRSTR
jgi:hypothetical protein